MEIWQLSCNLPSSDTVKFKDPKQITEETCAQMTQKYIQRGMCNCTWE